MLKAGLGDLENSAAPGGEDELPILDLSDGTKLAALEALHEPAARKDAGVRVILINAVFRLDGHGLRQPQTLFL